MAILVTSCHRDREKQQAIRDTWGKKLLPYFFIGEPYKAHGKDEIMCPVSDTYSCVPFKTHKQVWYAVNHILDYVFICDVDTYVDVDRLLDYPFTDHDYIGWRCDEGHASGGNGYFLSSRACHILSLEEPPLGYADMWVGRILQKNGIELHHDPVFGNGVVTKHLSVNGKYNPDMMYEEHIKRGI